MAAKDDFALQLSRFVTQAQSRVGQIQAGIKAELLISVVDGSTLTGSEGVPKDTFLLDASYSWKDVSAAKSQLSSNAAYAGVIEYDDPGFWDPTGVWDKGTLAHTHTKTGQRGSMRATIAGYQRIVSAVANGAAAKIRVQGLGEADGRNG